MEALKFFNNNKNGYCFASNHFNEAKYAFDFVRELYSLGASHVEVDGIYSEPDRLISEGGPYADILYVHLPEDKNQVKNILLAIANQHPDELDEEEENVLRLWWD